MIRRISGLSDQQWNSLIMNTELNLELNKTSFMLELIRTCLGVPDCEFILKMLGVKHKTFEEVISNTNMEHTAFRFWRHFCVENIRNGISHAGLPFAILIKTNNGYEWKTVVELKYNVKNESLESHGFTVGDKLEIILIGINDIETMEIKSISNSWLCYVNGSNNNFGHTMWQVKQLIKQNKE